jgi:HAE1 family hydrophobic/amphiphilic exporter-1
MVVGLISEDGSMDGNDLRDYAKSNLEQILARVPGVGEVEIFGIRITPCASGSTPTNSPDYHLTVDDVPDGAQDLQRGGHRRPVSAGCPPWKASG